MEGQMIGAYRVVRRIAAGGMGDVFLAERADGHFEQRVALKIIKSGLDSGVLLQRFEGERRILARLEHPNIARLIDGGVSPDGLPYFTMEFVEGIPIDRYCDENRLSVDERLALFETVCEAVQYAQRNLVIHRDLKPGNIFVTADGTVKLLDFGIAKLVDDDAGNPELTRTGARPMTPAYAAPEQIRGEPVTTATDVYALGVVLYEMLTGHRPYGRVNETPHELERAVLETLPQRPSAVCTADATSTDDTGGTTAEELSRLRATQPESLRRKLSGDLDNVCLMALRKEPDRRYSSAEQFLRDIRSYRAGRAVIAHRDSIGYRTRLFLRRNAAAVATATAVVVVLAAVVTFYTVRLAHERDRARVEMRKAAEVSDFIVSLFRISDPNQSSTVTARSLLDRGAHRVESELAGQPEVQAQMLFVVGKVYYALGLHADAIPLLERSLAIRDSLYGPGNRDAVLTATVLGDVVRWSGDFDGAEPILRDALEKGRESLGGDDPYVGQAMNNLAILLNDRARFEEAEKLYRGAIDIWLADGSEESLKNVAITTNNLALVLHEQGRHEEAEEQFLLALERQRAIFGDVHTEVVTTLYNYSALLRDMGNFERSEEIARQVLTLDRELLGPDHPDVAYSMTSLGVLLRMRGEYDGARELFQEALDLRKRTLGLDHPNTAYSARSLARLYLDIDRLAIADSLNRFSLEIHRRVNGERHPAVANRLDDLAQIAYERGDYAHAEELHRRAQSIRVEGLGEDAPSAATNRLYLGRAVAAQGRIDEAIAIERDGLAGASRTRGADHTATAAHMMALAEVLCMKGEYEEAEQLCRRALKVRRPLFPDDDIRVATADAALADVLCYRGGGAEALRLARQALRTRERLLPARHADIGRSWVILGRALCSTGRRDEGRAAVDRGIEIFIEARRPGHPEIARLRAKAAACWPQK